jgi:hypothetical protein
MKTRSAYAEESVSTAQWARAYRRAGKLVAAARSWA